MVLSRQPKPDVLINEISLMKRFSFLFLFICFCMSSPSFIYSLFFLSSFSCQHPAIVQFHDSFLVGDTLWVVMELVDGEDLTQVELGRGREG